MNVLIVDDNAMNRKLLHANVVAAGWNVLEAADGIEALALLDREKVDAIVSDILMPRMDGYRFCIEVRKSKRFRAIPFIFYSSAYSSPGDEKLALEMGADKFIKKPCPNEFLVESLREVMNAETRRPPRQPQLPEEPHLMREYNERLVARLEQKNIEMTAAETKFRALVEQSIVGIYVIQDERFVYVNPKMTEIFGISAEALCAPPVYDFVLPEDRELVRSNLRKRMEGRVQSIYYGLRIKRATGDLRYVEAHGSRIEYEGRVAILGTMLDITDRKRAEQRLAAQYAAARVLAESTTFQETTRKLLQTICQTLEWDVGELWTVDRQANVLRCTEIWHPPSTEFKEFVEHSQKMTFAPGVGLPGRVWAGGQPAWIEDVARDTVFSRAAVARKAGIHGGIAFPIRRRNETLAVLTFFSGEIRAPDEELLRMFNILVDEIGLFIERTHLEEQLRQAQKMEAIGQLAGGVAHDFNNILTIIQGYTQLLLEEEGFNEETREQLQEVFVAAERASNLTRQLLTFSRKQVMQSRTLDLNEVIVNLSKMLCRIIGEDVEFQTDLGKELPKIQADSGMLEQVLMNLSINARDAMPKGGQLQMRTEAAHIDDVYAHQHPEARTGEFVCLSVQDTGCGIAPEIMAHIFEPFFTTKAVGEGTGLGLATVFGIVQQHQGWMEVASQVGRGSTFKVFLPGTRREDLVEPGATLSKSLHGTETILLVEDEPALRSLAKKVLERHGYRVLEASSGVQALAVWKEHQAQIDLVLTDMVMPDGMNGRELGEKLTAQNPALRVLYSSGYTERAGDTDFMVKEGLNFLIKPYDSAKLLQAVRNILDAGI